MDFNGFQLQPYFFMDYNLKDRLQDIFDEGFMLKLIKEDIEVAIEKDPAARNFLEVVLLYPGVHALIGYRLAHVLWGLNLNFLATIYIIFYALVDGHRNTSSCSYR